MTGSHRGATNTTDMTSRADVNHSSLVIQAGGAAADAADVTADS